MSLPMSLGQWPASAAARGDSPFLVSAEGTMFRGELEEATARVASRLRAITSPGARVAIVLPSSAASMAALFGVLAADRVAVPIDARSRPIEVATLVRHARAELAIVEHAHVSDVDWPPGCRAATFSELFAAGDSRLPDSAAAADDPAVVLYTSGSTAGPKGVVLSHANLASNRLAWQSRYGLRDDDVIVTTLSFLHSFGLTAVVLSALAVGARIVLPDSFLPARVAVLAGRHRATVCASLASFYRYVALTRGCRAEDLASIRLFLGGGCTLPPAVDAAMLAKTGRHVVQTYGLTEAAPVVTGNPEADNRIGTVGTALDGVEIALAAPEGEGAGRELRVRSLGVMRGYLDDPAASAACLDDEGWLSTGDLGQIDVDGYVTILGRKKDLVIRGGEKVYPDEVESALLAHPAVREVAVVGVPDDAFGEVPAAVVVREAGQSPTERDLESHCRDRLASYKVPRIIVYADSLPKGPTGKVQKALVRRWLGRHRAT